MTDNHVSIVTCSLSTPSPQLPLPSPQAQHTQQQIALWHQQQKTASLLARADAAAAALAALQRQQEASRAALAARRSQLEALQVCVRRVALPWEGARGAAGVCAGLVALEVGQGCSRCA
jgi:hypothetical protein